MATSPTVNSWAVLLCKWNDDPSEPFPRWYYENLFTATGVGFNNMVDFFRLYTHGNIDSSGSEVFGWFTLPHSRSEYTGSGANNAGRQQLIGWATSAAAAANVNLGQYFGVVVCMNDPTDLFGDLGAPEMVCDNGSANPSPIGQEMLHGYDVNHARLNGSTADYMDPFDVMSVFNADMAQDPNFGRIGPGLNAAIMDSKGWLDPARVWTYPGGSSTVSLRPHHRRDLPGFLVAKVGQYYVEFRMNEGWDAAIGSPLVLVHRFDPDGHSYLMPAASGAQALLAGDTFSDAQVAVSVTSIDPVNRTASLSVADKVARVAVPPVVGDTASAAAAALRAAGLAVSIQQQNDPLCEHVGMVVAQSPSAGTTVPKGSFVQIWVGVHHGLCP
jgi:hypothetical protein